MRTLFRFIFLYIFVSLIFVQTSVQAQQSDSLIISDADTEVNIVEDNSILPKNEDIKEGQIELEDFYIEEKTEPLKAVVTETSRWDKLKTFIKGEPARNSIMAGMWSSHYGSKNEYRETNNLGAIQYKGIFVGTFSNSHSDQTVAIAAARTVYKKNLTKNMLFDAGYKLGPMYGYKEGAPNIGGFTVLPSVTLGLSYRGIGAAVNILPANAISFHTFINLDAFKK